MGDTRRDYRSYLLRLYRVRQGGQASWRASLHPPQGGNPLHFRSLREMVSYLEQEGRPKNGVGEQDRGDEEGSMDD